MCFLLEVFFVSKEGSREKILWNVLIWVIVCNRKLIVRIFLVCISWMDRELSANRQSSCHPWRVSSSINIPSHWHPSCKQSSSKKTMDAHAKKACHVLPRKQHGQWNNHWLLSNHGRCYSSEHWQWTLIMRKGKWMTSRRIDRTTMMGDNGSKWSCYAAPFLQHILRFCN